MRIKTARTGFAFFAFTAAQVLGVLLWIGYVVTWTEWWGVLGLIVGLITVPGLVIFPFIYWVVENDFPTNYFLVWFAMISLYFLASA
jgi:hypothetical protein